MKKSVLLLLFLLGFSHTYNLNNYFSNYFSNYFTNYFTNLTVLEKELIKKYALHYPNAFVVVNMLI